MEDGHMSESGNRGMDPNCGGTGLSSDFCLGVSENGHFTSWAFEDWLIKYRNRLAKVVSTSGTEQSKGLNDADS